MKKKFGTSLLAVFGIISLFFSCASNKQELPPPEYDFTLALRSDGDAYVGNYPEYTLRDISGEYTVEVTEELTPDTTEPAPAFWRASTGSILVMWTRRFS